MCRYVDSVCFRVGAVTNEVLTRFLGSGRQGGLHG